jgi:uncharacterized membrane protein YgdD (TMEM256/DUF423 family)
MKTWIIRISVLLALTQIVGLVAGYVRTLHTTVYDQATDRAYFLLHYLLIIALLKYIQESAHKSRFMCSILELGIYLFIGDCFDELLEPNPSETSAFEVLIGFVGVLSAYLEYKSIYVITPLKVKLKRWINRLTNGRPKLDN